MSSPTSILTYTGIYFELLAPTPAMVSASDLAYSLSHLNRYTGHVGVYSVAQHSVIVSELAAVLGAGRVLQLACLLHDGEEAYVADLSGPMKAALRALTESGTSVYDIVAARAAGAVARAFGIEPELFHDPLVKRCDMMARRLENRDLRGRSPDENCPLLPLEYRGTIERWGPSLAEGKFLDRLERLLAETA